MAMEEQIKAEFVKNGFKFDDETEILNKCLTFCIQFNLSPCDLVSSWDVYSLNRGLELSVQSSHMGAFLQQLQNERRETIVKKEPGLHFYSSDISMILSDEYEDTKENILGTPTDKRKTNGTEPSVSAQKTNGSVSASGKHLDTITPFAQRKNKFVVQFSLNEKANGESMKIEHDQENPNDDIIKRVQPSKRCSLQILSSQPEVGCKFMYDRMENKFNFLENRIKDHGTAFVASGLHEEPTDPTVASQRSVFAVGMICCEEEGRLKEKPILLQSRSTPSGSTQPPSDPSSSAGPSDQHNIPYWDPRSPYYIGEPGAWDGGRMIIYPEGDRGFCPNTDATPAVTRCIKSQYSGRESWPTWGSVPPHLKKRMMGNFEAECKWHPALDYKVRTNFPKKCSDVMKNAMYNARKHGEMPGWIYDEQWTQLQRYWQTPEFLKKSEQGKKARASEKGGSLHTGGSVSAATQKMRLEKKEKRTIPVPEMHKIRHIKKDKKGGEIWVEPRAKETWEKATKAFEDHMSTQQSECGSSTPAPLTLEDETKLWLEVNGGVKKGSAYGLGTLYASEKLNSSFLGSYAPAPSSSADPNEMTRMKEEIAELKRQNEAMRIASEAHETRMQEMMEKVLYKTEKRRKKSKRKGKSSCKGKGKSRRRHSSSSESSAESSSGSTQ